MEKSLPDFGPLEYNEDNKARFLRAGSALLKSVAKALVDNDVVETSKISTNRGGIAVSGEVYGYLYAPGLRDCVLVTITGGSFSNRRSDRLICYLQYRTVNDPVTHKGGKLSSPVPSRIIGQNVYVESINTNAIIRKVEQMMANFPATCGVA